jgi:hypothetical protein
MPLVSQAGLLSNPVIGVDALNEQNRENIALTETVTKILLLFV